MPTPDPKTDNRTATEKAATATTPEQRAPGAQRGGDAPKHVTAEEGRGDQTLDPNVARSGAQGPGGGALDATAEQIRDGAEARAGARGAIPATTDGAGAPEEEAQEYRGPFLTLHRIKMAGRRVAAGVRIEAGDLDDATIAQLWADGSIEPDLPKPKLRAPGSAPSAGLRAPQRPASSGPQNFRDALEDTPRTSRERRGFEGMDARLGPRPGGAFRGRVSDR